MARGNGLSRHENDSKQRRGYGSRCSRMGAVAMRGMGSGSVRKGGGYSCFGDGDQIEIAKLSVHRKLTDCMYNTWNVMVTTMMMILHTAKAHLPLRRERNKSNFCISLRFRNGRKLKCKHHVDSSSRADFAPSLDRWISTVYGISPALCWGRSEILSF